MSQRLPEVLENYLRYHRIDGSTEAAVKFYAKELRLFLKDLEKIDPGCPALTDLSSLHVLQHLGSMRERGLKPRSIRTRWQAITTWLNWCVNWGHISAAPAAKIKAPKVPKTRKPLLTEEQFASLLELCPLNSFAGARRQAMLWMMTTSGIRRNEMWMLKKKDLDWDASTIRVIHGKGQKERQIPFDRRCQRAMLRYIPAAVGLIGLVMGNGGRRRTGLRWYLEGPEENSGPGGATLKDTCHIFRRTFAANAVRQKIPRPFVKAVAGWSTMQMLDLYVEAMEAEEETIEAFREFKPFENRTDTPVGANTDSLRHQQVDAVLIRPRSMVRVHPGPPLSPFMVNSDTK